MEPGFDSGNNGRDFSAHARTVREDALRLRGSARSALVELNAAVRDALDRRPVATLAYAAAGWVLAAGLPGRIARWTTDLGLRGIAAALVLQFAFGNQQQRRTES